MSRGERVRVGGLCVALLLGGALLALTHPVTELDPADAWLLPGLAVLVAAAEFFQVRFRIGTSVDATNLVEAVLTTLVVVAPNGLGVLAVVGGQLVAGVLGRNSPLKIAFNTGQWALAFAVGSEVWRATPGRDVDTWSGAGTLALAVLVIGVVNVAAFGVVLLLTGNDLRALRPIAGIGWAAGLAVNVALGLLFAEAHDATPWALLLVPVPLIVLHGAHASVSAARAERARLAGMHRAAALLAEPLDPRPAIPAFLTATAEVFDCRYATLVLTVEGGREVHRVDVEGEVHVHVEPEDAATVEAALTAQLGPVRVSATDSTPLGSALAAAGHSDCLAAPMLDGGRVLGALLLLDQNGVASSAAGQLSVLGALAREVVAALAKGRLLDEVLVERRKLATVIGATSDGIASFDPDGTVRSWNPAMEEITGLDETAVLGRADVVSRLDPRTADGQPIVLQEDGPYPTDVSVRRRGGGRRRLACSWSRTTDEDGDLVVLVARDITPAEEFEALRAEFGRLVEQEAARRLVVEQLQAAVVPSTPEVEGLELAVNYVASDPKEPTGGDLWDWHVLPSGELHLAVVDVLGHGVAATKSALSVVHTLRSLALDDTPLEHIVERAARLLERQDAELVATVVLGRLDPCSGRLRIVSGGHPPALIASADGTVRQLAASGCAIGWPGAGTDDVEEVVLAAGDTLLLYTDGLVEARKDIVEGLESLERDLASLAAQPVTTMSEELVRRALAGAERRDDTLALVVRLGDRPVVSTSGPVPSGRWVLPPDVHEVPKVRREAVRWLADHGLGAGDLALVVSELLANAVRAARSTATLELALVTGGVEVVVTDDGGGLDVLPPADGVPALDGEGSRGLFLVRRLADDVELLPSPSGTAVRCRLPFEAKAEVPDQLRRDPDGQRAAT